MTYDDLKTSLSARLNRRDLTPTLTAIFIQDAIKRIQRELRVPAMERGVEAVVGVLFDGSLEVPSDLIQLIDITHEGTQVELDRESLQKVLSVQKYEGEGPCRMFTRRGSRFLVAPVPPLGDTIRIDYYAAFSPLINPTDTNVLIDIGPDLILQAACVNGCTHFSDKRKDGFEADYSRTLAQMNEQAINDELSGNAQIAPAYRFDLDEGF